MARTNHISPIPSTSLCTPLNRTDCLRVGRYLWFLCFHKRDKRSEMKSRSTAGTDGDRELIDSPYTPLCFKSQWYIWYSAHTRKCVNFYLCVVCKCNIYFSVFSSLISKITLRLSLYNCYMLLKLKKTFYVAFSWSLLNKWPVNYSRCWISWSKLLKTHKMEVPILCNTGG